MTDPAVLLQTAREHAAAGRWAELRALLGGTRALVEESPELVVAYAEALLRLGHPAPARDWLAAQVDALARRGARRELRRGTNMLGAAHFELGELAPARAAFERALELGRADGDDLLVARALNNLGLLADMGGARDGALALFQLALPLYQALGHPLGLAEVYHNMGIVLRERLELDAADEYEARAVQYARQAASPRLAAMARVGRAEVGLRRGDPRLAAAGARRAAEEFARLPDPAREADARRLLGVASLALGRADEAREAIERAVRLAHEHGSLLIEAESLRARAELLASVGARGDATTDARAAVELFARLGRAEDETAMKEWLEEMG
ncbi:MAG: tetratricopeptide repeat protein [Gemmatimonadaceae bacterium]